VDDESVLTSRFPEKEFFKKMGETDPKQGGLSGVPLRKMVSGEINEVLKPLLAMLSSVRPEFVSGRQV